MRNGGEGGVYVFVYDESVYAKLLCMYTRFVFVATMWYQKCMFSSLVSGWSVAILWVHRVWVHVAKYQMGWIGKRWCLCGGFLVVQWWVRHGLFVPFCGTKRMSCCPMPRWCLVSVFKQQFSIFKHFMYFTYFFTYMYFYKKILNNNFQFLNTYTKRPRLSFFFLFF